MSNKKPIEANAFENQVITLLDKYQKLKEENTKLKEDLAQHQQQLTDANKKIAELNSNYSRLKLAKAYGWNEKSKREADAKIAQLVRDIDKCLGLLNEID